jgi:hypothetical protein
MSKRPLITVLEAAISNKPSRDEVQVAYINGMQAAVEILENALDQKSFGFVIRRAYVENAQTKYQYISGLVWNHNDEIEDFRWCNSPHNSELFDAQFRDRVMNKLTEWLTVAKKLSEWSPNLKFEAIELFSAV